MYNTAEQGLRTEQINSRPQLALFVLLTQEHRAFFELSLVLGLAGINSESKNILCFRSTVTKLW
uniref:Uncharacterized protein n=1 Tax=Ciona intestinalis TaxID=7719 RepID=H2XM54_CIOIN